MGGSKNNAGPPKWMVKIMENPMNKWMIWGGKTPIFGNTVKELVFLGYIFRMVSPAWFDTDHGNPFRHYLSTWKHVKHPFNPWKKPTILRKVTLVKGSCQDFFRGKVVSFWPRLLNSLVNCLTGK